jgi:hypothetical protein
MTYFPARARRRQRRAAAWIVATVASGGVFAQSAMDAPNLEGIKAGMAVIAPSLTVGYAYDSNVLQLPDEANPEPDRVLTLQPAFLLTVPFSNSSFRFGDVLTYVDYAKTSQTQGKTSNDAEADLTLNFGSLDQLVFSAHNLSGVSETLAFDPAGEIGFQGNNFTLHNETITFSRVIPGARGYRFGLAREALKFDPDALGNFYNYRGFEGEAAYYQPLSSETFLSFGYLGSRYDQYDTFDASTVSRTESGDNVYFQIEGHLGPRQPYQVRLGWERLGFGGDNAIPGGDFSGVTGQASLSAIVGGGTILTAVIQRQPYRSYDAFNSHYIASIFAGTVERPFLGGTSVGGSLLFGTNGYSQPTPEGTGAYFREDRRIQLEAHANIALAERVAFRVSLARNRRYSNAPGADYNNTVVFGGFVRGWI